MNQSIAPPAGKRIRFVNLRLKLLFGLTIVYSLVFVSIYGWFYRYSSDRAMQRVQQDLVDTLKGTIAGIDAAEFQTLATVNVPPGQILPLTHPLYQKHQAWLQRVHQIQPRANPYTFIPGRKPYEVLFIGDFLRISKPESPTHFRESYTADPAKTRLYQGLTHLAITLTPYQDQWGTWVSAYGPLTTPQGKVVGGVGIDFRADAVLDIQRAIQQQFAIAFGITYISLFILVYLVSGIVTRPIIQLVRATELMSAGVYDQTLAQLHRQLHHQHLQDEVYVLAETFERMVETICQREELLQDYNQSLEEKVKQRTQELQMKNTQLASANAKLAHATRLKDEFLATMSHELRTPLNVILGMTEGLQDQIFGAMNEKQLRSLQRIENSGRHLLELINDILDIAKIESGQLRLDCAPTPVMPLCRSSLEFVRHQALTKHIQLEAQLPPQLPDLYVDERRMRQVLINLLSNAVKFTPVGGQVTLAAIVPVAPEVGGPGETILQLVVRDTGIGIAADDMQHLFQPFIQIDSALNRQYQGTGLGLALVKRLVELHGGQISVTSEVGSGSCFKIDLPCNDATLA